MDFIKDYDNDLIKINNTRFIFRTNFSNDPARDRFSSYTDKPNANLVIPSSEMAHRLMDEGFNVKTYLPKEEHPDEGPSSVPDPVYFVKIRVNYECDKEERKPVVYLVRDGVKALLDADSLGRLDHCLVDGVDVALDPYVREDEEGNVQSKTLYVSTMYVCTHSKADPFAEKYAGYAFVSPDRIPEEEGEVSGESSESPDGFTSLPEESDGSLPF